MKEINPRKILLDLALGRDPVAGGELVSCECLKNLDVARALFLGYDALEPTASFPESPPEAPNNAGRPWTTEEDDELRAEFQAIQKVRQITAQDMRDIAAKHGRTPRAIEARLEKLELMTRVAA